MGSLKCVAFDFDGVLVDSNEVKRHAYFEIFEPLGPIAGGLVTEALSGVRERDRYQILAEIIGGARSAERLSTGESDEELVSRYAREYNEICEEHAATCPEVGGATDTLKSLNETYPLYVNSSTPDEPLERIVARRGWASYFRGVYGSGHAKARNLSRVLEREGASHSDCVFVGDREVDRAAAKLSGWRFVAIENPHNDFREAPDQICRDLLEARTVILRL